MPYTNKEDRYKNQIQRWKRIKEKAVTYKGGSCEHCGFTGNAVCFDFHHVDPNTKRTNWNQTRLHTWSYIQEELDRCKLLCANCHRIEHSGSKYD